RVIQSQRQASQSQHDPNAIGLQQINNVGYSFYLGQIDTPDAPPISDDAKNQITQVLYADNFAKSLLPKLAIVEVNTLAAKSDQYIVTPAGNTRLGELSPEFLTGGGVYGAFGGGGTSTVFSLILLNKNLFSNGNLASTLSHELGHYIGNN